MKLMRPEPVKCIKLQLLLSQTTQENSNDTTDLYVNICKSEIVDPPVLSNSANGNWKFPQKFSPARRMFVEAGDGKESIVHDVTFHPEAFTLGQGDVQFGLVIADCALETLINAFKYQINRNCISY